MCSSEGQYQDVVKLQVLQKNVGAIAKICMFLHFIPFCALIIPAAFNSHHSRDRKIEYYTDPPSLIAVTIWVITLSVSVSLYFGAREKRRYLLVPFMILIGLLQAICILNVLPILFTIVNNRHYVSGFVPIIFVGLFVLSLFKMQKTTKNLYVELGKETPVLQPNLAYNPGTEQLYSGVYQPTIGVRPAENIVNGDVNQSNSGLRVNLPIYTPDIPSIRVNPSHLGDDCPPAYCETQHSNNGANIEPPPSYDDAMKKPEIV